MRIKRLQRSSILQQIDTLGLMQLGFFLGFIFYFLIITVCIYMVIGYCLFYNNNKSRDLFNTRGSTNKCRVTFSNEGL